MRLTQRGYRVVETVLALGVLAIALAVVGFAGWIEGGCGGVC